MGSWRERVKGGTYELTAYVGYNKNGKKIRKTKTIKINEKMSEKRLKKYLDLQAELFQNEVDSGVHLDTGKVTFEEFSQRWLSDYAEKQLQLKTINEYKYFLRRINQAIGHIRLDKLQAQHLNGFYSNLAEKGVRLDSKHILKSSWYTNIETDKKSISAKAKINIITLNNLLKGNATNLNTAEKIASVLNSTVDKTFQLKGEPISLNPDTVLKHHKLIHAILSKAYKWQVVTVNVADHAEPPKSRQAEAACYDEEQVILLLNAIKEEQLKYQVAVYLGVFGGLRAGEVVGLEWSDFNFDGNTLIVNRSYQHLPGMKPFDKDPKTIRGRRTITLPEVAMDILLKHKTEQEHTRTKLANKWINSNKVLTQWNGKPMNPQTPSHWLKKFLERKGLPHITFHQLRHTHVSLLIANDVDIVSISIRVGHAKASTTLDVYSHQFKSRDKAAADKLDNLVLNKKNPKTTT